MKLSESIKPISMVKSHMSEILSELARTRGKVIVTHNGEARAVLQDIESYEEMQESIAMLKIVSMSAKSMAEGKGESVEAAFADIRKRVKRAQKK